MINFLYSFKKSYLRINKISEKQCFNSLSYHDLHQLIRSLQLERRNYLTQYLECLEKKSKSTLSEEEQLLLEKEQIYYWKQHIHYEKMIYQCIKESEKRTEKNFSF